MPMVFGSAAQAVEWNGSKKSGKWRVRLSWWEDAVAELPEAVRPTAGDPAWPEKIVDSEAVGVAHLKEYEKFLRLKYPDLKRKKSRTSTRFYTGDKELAVDIEPVTAWDARSAVEDHDAMIDVAGAPAFLYWIRFGIRLHAGVTETTLLIVDKRADGWPPTADEVNALPGTPKSHGKVTFDGQCVAIHGPLGVGDLKKSATSVAALAKLANTGNIYTSDPDLSGDAFVLGPAKGAYTVETGEGPDMRWLRFTRV